MVFHKYIWARFSSSNYGSHHAEISLWRSGSAPGAIWGSSFVSEDLFDLAAVAVFHPEARVEVEGRFISLPGDFFSSREAGESQRLKQGVSLITTTRMNEDWDIVSLSP